MTSKRILVFIICLFLIGCASTKTRVGSDTWHEKRLEEIEESYKAGEIDKAQYLQLKTEADQVNVQYRDRSRSTSTHVGYRHYNHGSGVGIGVGF